MPAATMRDGWVDREDEHTPVSFAVHLAALLRQPVEEPADVESARELVTRLLLHRQCLFILDNAPDWQHIKYMPPMGTASTIPGRASISRSRKDTTCNWRKPWRMLRPKEMSG